eukprot:TRINITY_DN11691_c1_g1_i1.p2 TRINITY_DN11691_c1_g1~~TRINITY_DN11691_c1_g1_i1.p2  ORF type:complete len:143 (+),score=36.36 TRINITY_DN11691_c1_g1_i1:26-430(+)
MDPTVDGPRELSQITREWLHSDTYLKAMEELTAPLPEDPSWLNRPSSAAANKHEKEIEAVFEKLTDTKTYTGHHKLRFDEQGKYVVDPNDIDARDMNSDIDRGLGLAGRRDSQAPIADLSQITRAELGATSLHL